MSDPISAVVGGIGSIAGGLMGSSAASDAASAQQQAAQNATNAQLSMFNKSQQNLQPFYSLGANAYGTLAQDLGLGQMGTMTSGGSPTNAFVPMSTNTMGNAIPMSGSQSQSSVPSNIGPTGKNPFNGQPAWSLSDITAAEKEGMPSNWTPTQQQMAKNEGLSGQVLAIESGKLPAPQFAAPTVSGQGSQQTFMPNTPGLGGSGGPGAAGQTIGGQFTNADLNAQMAPNYAFQLQQGESALNNANAAGNGVLSGAAMKGMQNFVQGTAAGAYQNAFQNWMNTQNMNYQQLYNTAALGENAAATSGTQAVQTGANVGSNMVGAGNAAAAGIIGGNQALTNGLNGAAGYYQMGNMMGGGGGFGNLFGGGGTSGASLGSTDLSSLAGGTFAPQPMFGGSSFAGIDLGSL